MVGRFTPGALCLGLALLAAAGPAAANDRPVEWPADPAAATTPTPTATNPKPTAWVAWQFQDAGWAPQSILSIPIDNDDACDLAVASAYSDTLTLLVNDGTGRFVKLEDVPVGLVPGELNDLPRDVAVGDTNGDSRADLLVLSSGDPRFGALASPSLAVLLGRNTGGFQSPVHVPLRTINDAAPTLPLSLVAADANRDGNLDLLTANYDDGLVDGVVDGSFALLPGNGDGTFANPIVHRSNSASVGPRALAAADLDLDDDLLDVILVHEGRVLVTSLDRAGQRGPTYFLGSGDMLQDVAVTDFDRNGLLDVAVVDAGPAALRVWFDVASNGGFARETVVPLAANATPSGLATGDLDQDGFEDVAFCAFGSDDVGVLRGDGAGGFDSPFAAAPTGRQPRAIAVFDADADGGLDLATANQGDRESAYPDNPDVTVLLNRLPQRPPTVVGVLGLDAGPRLPAGAPPVTGVAPTGDGGYFLVNGDPFGSVYRADAVGRSSVVLEVCPLVGSRCRLEGVAFDPQSDALYLLDGPTAKLIRLQPASGSTPPAPQVAMIGPLARCGATALTYHPRRGTLFAAGPRRLVELDPGQPFASVLAVMPIDGSLDVTALAIDAPTGRVLLFADAARRVLAISPGDPGRAWASIRGALPPTFRLGAAAPGNGPGEAEIFGAGPTGEPARYRVALGFALPDRDGDRIPDFLEGWPPAPGQTHKLLDDSDGDGLEDGVEDSNRNGAFDADGVETDGRNRDTDGDGLLDGIEVLVLHTAPLEASDPLLAVDGDRDGLPQGFDPDDADPDTDNDRYSDGYEAAVLGPDAASNPALRPPLGDANMDRFVSNVDALIIQSLFLGNIGPSAAVFRGEGFRHTDTNRDAFISNLDALVAQAFFLDNLPLLPL